VGSRNVDAGGEDFTRKAAQECARQAVQVVSGGARGVDEVAMFAALDAGGTVVGVLADSILKSAVAKKYRDHIREKRLALVTAYSPDARFNVGNAMGRNKQIYALADFALIISAEKDKGGTWAGATEELKRDDPRPVLVRDGADVPKGNRVLIKLGAKPFPLPPWDKDLLARLSGKPAARRQSFGTQRTLFGEPAAPTSSAAAVKEKTGDYQTGRIEPAETAPIHEPAKSDLPAGIFQAVLPVLLDALKDWQSPKDLAEGLGVRKPQLDDWLKRAVSEGWIEKKNKPVLYRRIRQRCNSKTKDRFKTES